MKLFQFSPETREILERMPDAVAAFQHDDRRMEALTVSRSFLEMFGYTTTEEALDALNTDPFRGIHPEDIARVRKEDTVFVLPASCRGSAEKNGLEQCVYLTPGETAVVKGVPVEAVAAYNVLKPFHPKKNGWLGYVVTLEGRCLYVAGDTDETPDNLSVKCDIAMVPAGGTYTFDAKHAAKFVNKLRPAVAIPTHYGDIVGSLSNFDDFAARVDGGIEVVRKIG